MKAVSVKIAQCAGLNVCLLSTKNVEKHLEDSALSRGQKVKVVLAATMWNQPHIVILDEPEGMKFVWWKIPNPRTTQIQKAIHYLITGLPVKGEPGRDRQPGETATSSSPLLPPLTLSFVLKICQHEWRSGPTLDSCAMLLVVGLESIC